ncbi:hypothetical protein PI23P_02002 [Polaribacter irgensii 23-P]|uniref:Uncharacterized protein n=1 Tax=Polaribacter irgensii 23-P TaxID=313594 RepID=A4BW87_9FLAO|nr:hypothetical protein PI23P_02002 [Polaribacter irgensii 23-P]
MFEMNNENNETASKNEMKISLRS